jgi:hypothetical protein
MAVRMTPGPTALTRMPLSPSSSAISLAALLWLVLPNRHSRIDSDPLVARSLHALHCVPDDQMIRLNSEPLAGRTGCA